MQGQEPVHFFLRNIADSGARRKEDRIFRMPLQILNHVDSRRLLDFQSAQIDCVYL